MHQFFGDQWAYSLFNSIGGTMALVASLFFLKSKAKSISIYSEYIINAATRYNKTFEKIVTYALVILEALLFAYVGNKTAGLNGAMGRLVGTGVNYFGGLFFYAITWTLLSILLVANPLKNIDVVTMTLPVRLFFVKIACFCQGCCWGIPWKYGLYNYHYDHPGNQVPVQAIEAFFALAIFAFLLIYRRKAKTGTMFPIYMILYGGTRFFSEFFTAAYPDVFGPFNMYQLLCVLAVSIGLLMLIVMRNFGEKISDFFEKPHIRLEAKYEQKEAEERTRIEAEMKERLEKAKAARAKASVKYRKK